MSESAAAAGAGVHPAIAALERRAVRRESRDACGTRIVWRLWPSTAGADAPTLVLIHGSFGSWTHWLRNVEHLARTHRVLCPDVPGFGDSGDAPEARMPPEMGARLAAGLRAEMGELLRGSGGLSIAGFSLGAIYAGWMARALRAGTPRVEVDRLILISPGGLGARAERDLGLRRIPQDLPEQERRAVHRHNLERVMFGRADGIDEAAVAAQDRNVERARFRGRFSSRPDLLLEALRGSTVPVLAVWGGRDAFDVDVAPRVQAIKSVRPDARLHVLAPAGHWVCYEEAPAVNALVSTFLGNESI